MSRIVNNTDLDITLKTRFGSWVFKANSTSESFSDSRAEAFRDAANVYFLSGQLNVEGEPIPTTESASPQSAGTSWRPEASLRGPFAAVPTNMDTGQLITYVGRTPNIERGGIGADTHPTLKPMYVQADLLENVTWMAIEFELINRLTDPLTDPGLDCSVGCISWGEQLTAAKIPKTGAHVIALRTALQVDRWEDHQTGYDVNTHQYLREFFGSTLDFDKRIRLEWVRDGDVMWFRLPSGRVSRRQHPDILANAGKAICGEVFHSTTFNNPNFTAVIHSIEADSGNPYSLPVGLREMQADWAVRPEVIYAPSTAIPALTIPSVLTSTRTVVHPDFKLDVRPGRGYKFALRTRFYVKSLPAGGSIAVQFTITNKKTGATKSNDWHFGGTGPGVTVSGGATVTVSDAGFAYAEQVFDWSDAFLDCEATVLVGNSQGAQIDNTAQKRITFEMEPI